MTPLLQRCLSADVWNEPSASHTSREWDFLGYFVHRHCTCWKGGIVQFYIYFKWFKLNHLQDKTEGTIVITLNYKMACLAKLYITVNTVSSKSGVFLKYGIPTFYDEQSTRPSWIAPNSSKIGHTWFSFFFPFNQRSERKKTEPIPESTHSRWMRESFPLHYWGSLPAFRIHRSVLHPIAYSADGAAFIGQGGWTEVDG